MVLSAYTWIIFRNFEPWRGGGFSIDDHMKFGWFLRWQIFRRCAVQNAVHEICGPFWTTSILMGLVIAGKPGNSASGSFGALRGAQRHSRADCKVYILQLVNHDS